MKRKGRRKRVTFPIRIRSYKTGGTIKSNGHALVHKGELVLSSPFRKP